MFLIKNANLLAPDPLGIKDLLIGGGKILAIDSNISVDERNCTSIDAEGKNVCPGFIDQHVHILGAGGKRGFSSITPELNLSNFISCGTTTAVGLLGTDGATKSIKNLYAKAKALEMEGMSSYIYTGYYGLDPVYLTESVQDDMVFIEKVLGCKIAISDVRSSYPEDIDLLRILRQVRVGGMVGNKKGIMHIHLGNLKTKLDVLFRLVEEHQFPIENISPTHVGRTEELFHEAIRFAKLGGMIDITTGASKYTEPYISVITAIEKGVSIDKMTFSSDGNAGLDRLDENGKFIGIRAAPIDQNWAQVRELIKSEKVSKSDALRVITANPANNLGLKNKGQIGLDMDADLCIFDDDLNLTDVFCMGQPMMQNGSIIRKGNFE